MSDALEIASHIFSGETSAVQVMWETVERVRCLDRRFHAVCNLQQDIGFEQAERIDAWLGQLSEVKRRTVQHTQPFLGVPSLLKDLGTAAQGLPSSMGSKFFGHVDWAQDCELVTRLRRSGMVLFGRTASSELGLAPTTEAPVYGEPTQNPWAHGYSAGGSSGGAAAAVSSGMVALAHAGDGAGSIRIPASCCGLVGLKTSRGLQPSGPQKAEGWGGLVTDHLITMTVRDCATALDFTAGSDIGAPYAAPPHSVSCRDAVQRVTADPATVKRRRIAFVSSTYEGAPIDPEVAAAVTACARFLIAQGHHLEQVAPPVSTIEVMQAILPLIACHATHAIDLHSSKLGRPPRPDELQATTAAAATYARSISGTAYVASLEAGNQIRRKVASFLNPGTNVGFDFFLSPVLAVTPARIGRYPMTNKDYLDYRLGRDGLIHYSPFAPLANLTGMPCIGIPFGMSAGGLPIGVQVMGPLGSEQALLELAAQIEVLRPWPHTASLARRASTPE